MFIVFDNWSKKVLFNNWQQVFLFKLIYNYNFFCLCKFLY